MATGTIDSISSLISSTSVGQYASRSDAASAILGGMDVGVRIGQVGITGVSSYMFFAYKRSSTQGIVMMMNNSSTVRLLVNASGTVTESSLTGS